MSGFRTDLLTGIAVALNAASIGTYRATGVYQTTETAIVFGTVPQGPDRCITLTTYGVSDDPSLSNSVIGLQVRCRWGGANPTLVDDLADTLHSYLLAKCYWTLSTGVYVAQCQHASGPVSLGQDENRRWSNSTNYYLTVHRPSTNRT